MRTTTYLTTAARALAGAALLLAAGQALAADTATRPSLTLDGARRIAAAAVAEAQRDGHTGAIAIVDDGGQLLYLERLDGTFPAAARIATGKARTAALFRKPTRAFEDIIRNGRTPMIALEDFTPLAGGDLIEVGGQIVGAIGVSGAASAQRDDEVAIVGAKAAATLNATASASPAPVTYLDGPRVTGAFRKGAPLLETGGYKVHASHRDGPGQVEVHTRDTDIIYVVQGTARLVTGGTVKDAREIGPEEIRGARIEAGDARSVSPGDVVVVPNGTPHWFEQVPGDFQYFVVKVRS